MPALGSPNSSPCSRLCISRALPCDTGTGRGRLRASTALDQAWSRTSPSHPAALLVVTDAGCGCQPDTLSIPAPSLGAVRGAGSGWEPPRMPPYPPSCSPLPPRGCKPAPVCAGLRWCPVSLPRRAALGAARAGAAAGLHVRSARSPARTSALHAHLLLSPRRAVPVPPQSRPPPRRPHRTLTPSQRAAVGARAASRSGTLQGATPEKPEHDARSPRAGGARERCMEERRRGAASSELGAATRCGQRRGVTGVSQGKVTASLGTPGASVWLHEPLGAPWERWHHAHTRQEALRIYLP